MACLFAAAILASLSLSDSFRVESAAWNATHVVVATSDLTVVESWAGDLKPGTMIQLAPVEQHGKRMILFLRKNGNAWAFADEWKDSVAWSESGRISGYWQMFVPGEAEFQDLGYSEPDLRKRVAAIRRLREKWDATLAMDCRKRPRELHQFLTQSERQMSFEVFAELDKCGADSSRELHQLVDDPSLKHLHANAMDALVKVDGQAFAMELLPRLERELAFWKMTAPNLKSGWWNDIEAPQTSELRERYGETYAILRALTKLKVSPARERVIQFRDYWRSMPHLEDRSGLDQMSRECDLYLSQVH